MPPGRRTAPGTLQRVQLGVPVPHGGFAGLHCQFINNFVDKSQTLLLVQLAITGNHEFHSFIKSCFQ